MIKVTGIVLVLLVVLTDCSKSTSAIPDCERFHYGAVQFNFQNPAASHRIVAYSATSSFVREKIFDADKNADSLRLPPDTYFVESYFTFPNSEEGLSQKDTIMLTLCKDRLQITLPY